MTDTPTHRAHILQVKMQQLAEWTKLLQAQRAQIVEKLVRVKAHTKIARSIQVNTAIERTLSRIERDLTSTEEKLNKIADNMNKCRGLFLELSDFELVLEPQEHVHGNYAASETDRRAMPESATRPANNGSAVHDGRTTASAASATDGTGTVVLQDAGRVDNDTGKDRRA